MAMRLFFTLIALFGSGYLLFRDRNDRYAMGALAAAALGLLLQMHWITLRIQYARTVIWAAIAICAGLIWNRQVSKTESTVAAGVVFVSALTVALSLRMLR